MVEQLAARLLRIGGIDVETRVMLPPAGGTGGRREIDILIRIRLPGGNEALYAVECKNEKKPIEAEYIDAFYGKLTYLGIPAENGIFVSRSTYRRGAVERAAAASVRLLRLTGLKDDGLTAMVLEAIQSVVYLLADIEEMTVSTSSNDGGPLFCTEDGSYAGNLMDLVHRAWAQGGIPRVLGQHEVVLAVPPHWRSRTAGEPAEVFEASAKVKVIGVVYTVVGEATTHTLTDHGTGVVQRGEIQARWDETKHRIVLASFGSSDELERHLQGLRGLIHVVARNVPMPRINVRSDWGRLYWPPSDQVLSTIVNRFDQGLPIGQPQDDFEGTVFDRVFDPVAAAYVARFH
ncbi:hypothetical protein OP10G_2451 [Fimbriimonas ginsengisoli Gsoil 348]|uniref:Restriction endonuclease type IV Mrr domain-containing protein n=2 Tax=Fimbriimonas ginsengisoli TaxID=1005039 RepID=A0A068NW31_FIMGI|nr:hypothetical protein OP10G_2451 [Fimbriimonas ginsengisoli Gsoil 348]